MNMRMGLMVMMLLAQGAVAMPITYDFHQPGYGQQGAVNGFFSGEDLDGDGVLSSFAGEVSDFQLTFSRNDAPLFSLDLADLVGLVYSLDGLLGDSAGEGILAFDWKRLFVVGPNCGNGSLCSFIAGPHVLGFSSQPLYVTAQVPEPGTMVLLLLGVAGLIWARRRQSE